MPEADFGGRWIWLFPTTYAIHIAEESLGFPAFVARHAGVDVTTLQFILVNAVLWCAMVGVLRRRRREASPWVIPALGVIVGVNALLHLGATVATGEYAPGVGSGTLLWLPLGVYAVVSARRALPARTFGRGVAVGLVVHGLLPVLLLVLGRRG